MRRTVSAVVIFAFIATSVPIMFRDSPPCIANDGVWGQSSSRRLSLSLLAPRSRFSADANRIDLGSGIILHRVSISEKDGSVSYAIEHDGKAVSSLTRAKFNLGLLIDKENKVLEIVTLDIGKDKHPRVALTVFNWLAKLAKKWGYVFKIYHTDNPKIISLFAKVSDFKISKELLGAVFNVGAVNDQSRSEYLDMTRNRDGTYRTFGGERVFVSDGVVKSSYWPAIPVGTRFEDIGILPDCRITLKGQVVGRLMRLEEHVDLIANPVPIVEKSLLLDEKELESFSLLENPRFLFSVYDPKIDPEIQVAVFRSDKKKENSLTGDDELLVVNVKDKILIAHAYMKLEEGKKIFQPQTGTLVAGKGYMQRAITLLLLSGKISEWNSMMRVNDLGIDMYERMDKDPRLSVEYIYGSVCYRVTVKGAALASGLLDNRQARGSMLAPGSRFEAEEEPFSVKDTSTLDYSGRLTPFFDYLESNPYLPISELPECAVVDIGASEGFSTVEFAGRLQKLNPKLHVYGVDPGKHVGQLDSGKADIKQPSNLIFIRDDHRLRSAQRPQEPIKLILSFNVWRHYGTLQALRGITEMGRSLDENGLLIIGNGGTRNTGRQMEAVVFQKVEGQLKPREIVTNLITGSLEENSTFWCWGSLMPPHLRQPFKEKFTLLDSEIDGAMSRFFIQLNDRGRKHNGELLRQEIWQEQLRVLREHKIIFAQLPNGFIAIPLNQMMEPAALPQVSCPDVIKKPSAIRTLLLRGSALLRTAL